MAKDQTTAAAKSAPASASAAVEPALPPPAKGSATAPAAKEPAVGAPRPAVALQSSAPTKPNPKPEAAAAATPAKAPDKPAKPQATVKPEPAAAKPAPAKPTTKLDAAPPAATPSPIQAPAKPAAGPPAAKPPAVPDARNSDLLRPLDATTLPLPALANTDRPPPTLGPLPKPLGDNQLSLGTPHASPALTLPPPIPMGSATQSHSDFTPGPSIGELERPQRRAARRRPAGPVRGRVAANDDAPSIGGLIYALDQKPSTQPFRYAAIVSVLWAIVSAGFAWAIIRNDLAAGATMGDILGRPATFVTLAAVLFPIAILWFLALLAWRSEELRLRSSTMAEVAIRLAEPDRMAEQQVASLGQAVRRQVAFMNDAISRALGRAGELEALVHNEVSALERSYEENEQKIRGLIQELSGERHALLNTSERVTETLKTLGTDIPVLIDRLSNQQIKLAEIIKGAGDNLTALESAVGQSTDKLTHTLGTRTDHLQTMLEQYTSGLAMALGSRTDQFQQAIASYVDKLNSSLTSKTETLQAVFEEYAHALDTSLTNRAQALDIQLVERTKALDSAFGQRLRAFDESIKRSTLAIDSAIGEKASALTHALDSHAKTFGDTITRQASDLDEQLMQGITSVRRTSENITRQSLKAIEGLAGQSEMLKNVSENLLGQINSVTSRFEGQGQNILRAANALENANFKIENTLQHRHAELTHTIDRLSGKADEFGRVVEGYSSSIEGSLTDAEKRARQLTEQLRTGTEAAKQTALADLERFRVEADAEGDRALADLRHRFSSISNVVNEQLTSLTSRLDQTSDDVRQRASRAAQEIAAEQARLREQMDRLPVATRESAEAMRRALQDQLRAIEHLSNLTNRAAQQRDVSAPAAPVSLGSVYAAEASRAEGMAIRSLGAIGQPEAPRPPPRPEARRPQMQMQPAALPRPAAIPAGETAGAWTLGDLLHRASQDEDHSIAPPPQPMPQPQVQPQSPLSFHRSIEVIARSLDAATTAAIWSRVLQGQQGIMARSIYTAEGRAAFDDLAYRYQTEPEIRRTVDKYLADFDGIRRDAEQRDSTGRAVQNHLLSDMGRVYLFLAHVSGRLV